MFGGNPSDKNYPSEQVVSNGVETALSLTQTNGSSGDVARGADALLKGANLDIASIKQIIAPITKPQSS